MSRFDDFVILVVSSDLGEVDDFGRFCEAVNAEEYVGSVTCRLGLGLGLGLGLCSIHIKCIITTTYGLRGLGYVLAAPVIAI